MYLKNFYHHFNVPMNSLIQVIIKHGGLKGRTLSASNPTRYLPLQYRRNNEGEGVSKTEIHTTLEEIGNNMTDIVEKFTTPLFEQFNFQLEKSVLDNIVSKYLQGIVS